MYEHDPQLHLEHERHFSELVQKFGGLILLEYFNKSELTGLGSVAFADPEETYAIAVSEDGKTVHVRNGRIESFNLSYSRARQLAVEVAREELATVEAPVSDI